MTLQQIIEKGGIGLIILMTLIQISPIKIDPWTWLADKVGGALNRKLEQRMATIENEFRSFRDAQQEQNALYARTRILRFGDEVLNDNRHTKEHFEQILCDIDEYEHYCAEHPLFKNNKTVLTSKRIKDVYAKLLKNNDFL